MGSTYVLHNAEINRNNGNITRLMGSMYVYTLLRNIEIMERLLDWMFDLIFLSLLPLYVSCRQFWYIYFARSVLCKVCIQSQ
jgi:hypothetical protein